METLDVPFLSLLGCAAQSLAKQMIGGQAGL